MRIKIDSDNAADLSPPIKMEGLPEIRKRLSFQSMAWSVCKQQTMSFDEIAAHLRRPNSISVFETALLEHPVEMRAPCKASHQVTASTDFRGRWELNTTGLGDTLLMISTRYEDGWRAFIDGEEVRTIPAYGIIIGVVVPTGKHHVQLRFQPRWLAPTLIVSAFGLIVTLFMLMVNYMPRRHRGFNVVEELK